MTIGPKRNSRLDLGLVLATRWEQVGRYLRGNGGSARWALAFVAIWALLTTFSSAGSLKIEVDSTVRGTSQVFYHARQATRPQPSSPDFFSEQESVSVPIEVGRNQLTFSLPRLERRMRWDPFNGAGAVDVRSIRAGLWWSAVPVSLDALDRGSDVERMIVQDQVLHIETTSDATDPQTILTVPVYRILLLNQLGFASVSALILGALLLCVRLDGLAARGIAALRDWMAVERPAIRSLPTLIAMAFLFHFSSLASFSLSVDDEYSAFRTNPDVWIRQGRWTVYCVERFLLPQPTVPYLPDAIFCVLAAISYVLLSRAHGLTTTWRTYALFPIFCAFPTWAFIAEFYANLPSVSLGLFLSSAAAFLFQRTAVLPILDPHAPRHAPRAWLGLAAQVLLLATAIGAYQSFLFAFVGSGLGIIVLMTLSKPGVRPGQFVRMLAWLTVASVAGLGLYALIQKVLIVANDLQVAYIDEFVKLDSLLKRPGDAVDLVLDEVKSVYFGSASLYGASLSAIGAIIVLGATSILYADALRGRGVLKAMLLALSALALLMPFSLMTVAPDLPLRALVGVPYAVWLFGVLALAHRLYVPRILGAFAVAVGGFQILYLLSLYAASTALTGSHDRMLAESVYERVASANDDFDRGKVYDVDFFGAKSVNAGRYPAVTTTTLGRSFFDWDGGNPQRIVTYMALLGYDNLRTVGVDQRRLLATEYQAMPVWPARDSVKVVDGVTLVKLSNFPDPSHAAPP